MGAVDGAAEVGPDVLHVADDGAAVVAGAAGVELGLVAVDGREFLLPEGRDIQAEGGGEVEAEVEQK